MDDVATGGIDFTDVNRVLEEEGIEKFEVSFDGLLEVIARKAEYARDDHPTSSRRNMKPLSRWLQAAFSSVGVDSLHRADRCQGRAYRLPPTGVAFARSRIREA